jgi:hypothetical protein
MDGVCLTDDAPDEEDSDDERHHAAGECDHGGEEAETDGAGVHQPLAWSTTSAVKDGWPGGVIWNDSPHLPTMNRAGAERE